MTPFALVLLPAEAQAAFPGWPDGAWLIACCDADGRRWDAGLEADLPGLVGRLPVWPPLGGFAVAAASPEEEAALLRHMAAVPGLAAAARARFEAPPTAPEEGTCAADIDWEE